MQIQRNELIRENDDKAKHELLRAQLEMTPFCEFFRSKSTARSQNIPQISRFRAKLEVQKDGTKKLLIQLQADLELNVWSVFYPQMNYWRFEDHKEQTYYDQVNGGACKINVFLSHDHDIKILAKVMKALHDIPDYRFSGVDIIRGQECEMYEQVSKNENEEIVQSTVCLYKNLIQGELVYEPLMITENTFTTEKVNIFERLS